MRGLRRLLLGVAVLLGLAIAVAVAGLALAHFEIRRRSPPLPSDAEVLALADALDPPTAMAWQLTASQVLPRRQVLDPARDTASDALYVMSHPAFALAWADGRILLVDLGMEREAAVAFGRPLAWLGGAPLVFHGGAASALGPAAGRVGAVLFTHLHSDHVEGVLALCAARTSGSALDSEPRPAQRAAGERSRGKGWGGGARTSQRGPAQRAAGERSRVRAGARLVLPQTSAQADLANYTTRPGRSLVARAGCLAPGRLPDGALAPVAGFGGVGVVDAAGHTPGSQVVLAVVRGESATRRLAFTGDVANHVDGIRMDVGKPPAYRLLVVPESEERLGRMRRWLRHLEADLGFELVVAHDRAQLEALGFPPFTSLRSPGAG